MAGITLAQAEAKLALWMDAEANLAASQSYEIETGNGRRKLTRADLAEVRTTIEYWNRWCIRLDRTGGIRVREVIPR